jgi:HNH endonuclease
MTKYAKFYQSTDFLQATISSHKQPTAENLAYIHAAFEFIKSLAQTAHDSKDLTLLFSANDGLRVYLGGSMQAFIKPTQKYLLFHFFDDTLALPSRIMADPNLSANLRKSPNGDYTMLEASADKLIALSNLITELAPDKTIDFETDSLTHPRYFPGDVREEALRAFESADRLCGGVNGKTKPHRLKLKEPIEFDHILPHSRGGASSLGNLQILCVACNRTKSGSAR